MTKDNKESLLESLIRQAAFPIEESSEEEIDAWSDDDPSVRISDERFNLIMANFRRGTTEEPPIVDASRTNDQKKEPRGRSLAARYWGLAPTIAASLLLVGFLYTRHELVHREEVRRLAEEYVDRAREAQNNGNWKEELALLQQAQRLYDDLHYSSAGEIETLKRISNIMFEMRRDPNAESVLLAERTRAEERGDLELRFDVYCRLSEFYIRLNRFDDAEKYLNAAFDIRKEDGVVLARLRVAWQQRERGAEAWNTIHEMSKIIADRNSFPMEARVEAHIAASEAYKLAGETQLAANEKDEALRLAGESGGGVLATHLASDLIEVRRPPDWYVPDEEKDTLSL